MAGTTRPAITRMRYALDRGANSLSVSRTAIGIAAHTPLSDELFRRDRQVTNPFANRMKDPIGDRCGDAGRAQLAYPFTADPAPLPTHPLHPATPLCTAHSALHR